MDKGGERGGGDCRPSCWTTTGRVAEEFESVNACTALYSQQQKPSVVPRARVWERVHSIKFCNHSVSWLF